MKHIKFILAIILMLVVVVLVVQNHEAFSTDLTFRVDLPWLHGELPNFSVYGLVVIAFLFGVLITGLYGIVERFRLKREIHLLQKTSREKDAELSSLRNLPITSREVPATAASESGDSA